jgi:hypothetical protein
MTNEILSATATINASAETIFAVLANPARHAAIDGTGWVENRLTGKPITAPGQVFRMAMYHADYPSGDYEMASRVMVCEPRRAIS